MIRLAAAVFFDREGGQGTYQKNREVNIRRNVLAFRGKFCKFPQGCSLDE